MDADEFPNNPIKVGPDLERHISELSCNNGFATEFKVFKKMLTQNSR